MDNAFETLLAEQPKMMHAVKASDAIDLILAARRVCVRVTWCREHSEWTRGYIEVNPLEVVGHIRADGAEVVNVCQYGDSIFLGW